MGVFMVNGSMEPCRMVVGGENSKIEWVDMKKRHFKIIENTDHAHRARLACHPTAAPIRGRERGKRVVVEHRVVGGRLGTLLQDGEQVSKVSLFRIKDA